ncbi:MAG TPA: outer membrane beta-barrel protein, partial [Chitinophagaceae bacterium]
MDDLLRKAAEDYPLKIGDGNWQAVAAQLTQQEIPAKRKRGTWKYGVCLLVLFIFLLTADLFMKQKAGTGSGPAISTGNDQSNTLNSGTIRQPTSLDPLRETNKTASSDLKQHRISPVTTFQYDGDAQLSTNSPVISRTVPWKTGTTNYTIGKNGNKPGLDMVQADTAVKASYLISIEPASTSQERKSGVYFGVIFGPELNQVKGQRLEKTGFDVGVAAGYRFNDRFAVETGLLLSRKYYYSDAKYFNMDMPGMKLLSLEGSCTVLEIPLKVRYDVLNKRNGKLYTSGGFSTYLLRKEKNNY